MNILYIWDADYPWDIRVEKICKSLMASGNQVHIASRNLNRGPVYELDEGLNIHRLKPLKNPKANYALSFPAFFNPVWKYFLDKIITSQKIDLIIVRDLPMAIAGIWAGKRHSIPVIFDMAEDYVALLKGIWKHSKFKGLNLLIRNPYIAKMVERYVLRHIDYILVVVEEAKKVVCDEGFPNNRISIVSNTPDLEIFKSSSDQHAPGKIGEKIRDNYSAIYTGGVQKGRGIQTVIDAIPEIIKSIPDFLFVIVGDGYAVGYFRELIRKKGLEDYVLWTGWIEHNQLYSYINDAKIGLIPHFASEHVNTTIPNKLFDYMALGLTVLTSDALPLDRIVREEKIGASYRSGDARALVDALLQIYSSDFNFGKQGKSSAQRTYNWQIDKAELLRVINLF